MPVMVAPTMARMARGGAMRVGPVEFLKRVSSR